MGKDIRGIVGEFLMTGRILSLNEASLKLRRLACPIKKLLKTPYQMNGS